MPSDATSLRSLQHHMVGALLGQHAPQPAAAGDFGVVVQSVRGGRIAVLRAHYPSVSAHLGTDAFARAALGYWRALPQSSADLDAWTRQFPRFLHLVNPDDIDTVALAQRDLHER